MYYVPLLIVCSLSPGFMGDQDSGPTCLKFTDSVEVHYYKLSDCANRIREILEAVTADKEKLNQKIPGPWHFKGHCLAPVVDEKANV